MSGAVWFITVIGTLRDRTRSKDAVETLEKQGASILELDQTDAERCGKVFAEAESIHGHIDVLLNNAGMSYLGMVEDFTRAGPKDEEAKAQMEVNFHGPLRLVRAALPGMRKRRSGTIVNITSIAGVDGLPICGLYAASKFAVEGTDAVPTFLAPANGVHAGLSESLARELAEHNVQVLLVEPGAFRTNFISAYKKTASSSVEHYDAGKQVFEKFHSSNGAQTGDPKKAACSIVEAVSGSGKAGHLKGKILRLPLGSDCVQRYEAKVKSLGGDLEAAKEISLSTDFQ